MNIRRLRKAKGLTQIELAQMLNATQKVVTSYETNDRVPPLEKLQALAAIFDVSIDEIVGRSEAPVKVELPRVHGNSRSSKIQELYEQLPPLEQRSILKQIKALVQIHNQSRTS